MTLRCPVDGSLLAEARMPGARGLVAVDRCAACGGVFLDADELLQLSGDADLNAPLRHRASLDDSSGRLCPACGVRMDMETARGVDLEACPGCDGLWLDRGELETLLASAAGRRVA